MRWTMVAAAVAVVVAATTAQAAETDPRSELSVRFGTGTPGASTGLRLRVLYKHPADANRKPPPVDGVRVDLPEGTRIDGSALPRCEATDDELQGRGRAACPADSRLGAGSFTAITGFGPPVDPFVGDLTLFNGGDQVIELVTFKGTEATAGTDRLRIRGHSLVADHVPATPGGPPDNRTTPREITWDIPPAGRTRPFLTTPPACPASGSWSTRGTFTFTDGGFSTVTSQTPCLRGTAPIRKVMPRLLVSPRRVRAGRTTRFRFRVRSARSGCRRGAIVRFAGRRARMDRRGRTTIRVRLGRLGRRPARVAKRGCPAARAWVRIVR